MFSGGLNILAKPTHDCNLMCDYCYDVKMRRRYKGKYLRLEDIDYFLSLVPCSVDYIDWLWHGGEPTLLGVEYYKNAYNILYKYHNIRFTVGMQSNGVLLDDEWLEFSNNYGCNIGLSFDLFTQEVRRGSSLEMMYDKIKLFRKHGQNPGVISVITNKNIHRILEYYKFFKDINIKEYSMNFVFNTGEDNGKDLIISDREEFIKYYSEFVSAWLSDVNGAIKERTTINMLGNILGLDSDMCGGSSCAYKWIGLTAEGDLYPCASAIPRYDKLGNIYNINKLEDIYKGEAFLYYIDTLEQRDKICRKCKLFNFCKGGCNSRVLNIDVHDYINEQCMIFKGLYLCALKALANVKNGDSLNKTFLDRIRGKNVFLPFEYLSVINCNGHEVKWVIDEINNVKSYEDLENTALFKLNMIFNNRNVDNDIYSIYDTNWYLINEILEG